MDRETETMERSVVADGADSPTVCARCGERIETTEWHPMRSRWDGDELHLYAFCDEKCRREWDETRSASGE